MGFFGGLITLLSVIGIVIAAFVVGALVGFVSLYLAMKKFCPEALLMLNNKVHADNQASIKKDGKERDDEYEEAA